MFRQHLPPSVSPIAPLLPSHPYLASIPDSRCYELGTPCRSVAAKAAYLAAAGIPLPVSSVIKTVYFSSQGDRLYGAIVPGDASVDMTALGQAILEDIARTPGRPDPHYTRIHLRKASRASLPIRMDYGTCGPFLTMDDVRLDWRGRPERGKVGKIFVDVDDWTRTCDFAVPGRPEIALHARLDDVLATVDAALDARWPIFAPASIRVPPRIDRSLYPAPLVAPADSVDAALDASY